MNPYEDQGGLGIVTTVAKPVYSKETAELDRAFLGVAAHDVLLSELEISGVTYKDVLGEIVSRVPRCGNMAQTECQLQVHRNAYLDDSVCVDPITSSWTGKLNLQIMRALVILVETSITSSSQEQLPGRLLTVYVGVIKVDLL